MSKAVSKFVSVASMVLALAFMASCIGDDSSAFVGKWIKENGSEPLELFKDGTGVAQEKKESMSISWKVMDKRFVWTATVLGSQVSQAYNYEISGRMLTLTDDKGKSEVYVKFQEGKIEGEVLKDNRDGKKYKTVIIGAQTWMAENLNYEASGSVCYSNDFSNCQKYGRLYDWNTAKGVCPDGWHLPSNTEWAKLAGFVGRNNAGKKLKTAYNWQNNGNGTDNYGFSALPNGNGRPDGSFRNVGYDGFWWSSSASERSNDGVYVLAMRYNHENATWDENTSNKSFLFSVRCVQDKVKPVGDYKNGKKHGEWKFFHENGKLKEIGNYIYGEGQGEWKWFYENGNLKSIINFKDSERHGECKWFYENGNLEQIENYIDGKLNGEVKYFHENGNLKGVKNYKDGSPLAASSQNANSATPGVYPQGSERLLTYSDLQNISKKDLRIMRNEIFARHGYIFKSDDLKEHFKNQNWYTPKYADVNSMLTNIETKNVQFILRHE